MTEKLYIESSTNLYDRWVRYCAIIEALELLIVESAGKENIKSYMLNDGQTKIETEYRGIENIMTAINAMEVIKNKLQNKLNGRGTVLRSWQGQRK